MPELPEVETVVNTLRPRLAGRRLLALRLLRQDILRSENTDLRQELIGRTVRTVERRGKKILIALEGGGTFCIHLGMTGQLTIEPADKALQIHTHLVLDIGQGQQLRFRDPRRFGGLWWVCNGQAADQGIGPEPLTLPTAELARRLTRTRRAIKTALLDQTVVAGLGNIYVDESLFAAGIHPLTPANRLSSQQVATLGRSIKRILKQAIRHRGSSFRDYVDANGQSGQFQDLHQVYAREGQPCRTCQTPLERILLGGRSTHFCPRCQPQ